MIEGKKIIFLAILALAAVFIAGYFSVNKGAVSLEVSDNGSDKIVFSAKTSGNVFMPNSRYFYPTGAWEIYKFADNEWKKIVPGRDCTASCDTICETGPLYCVQGGPAPICQLASSEEIFEWGKKYVDYKEKDCGDRTFQCGYPKDAESGRYKIKFTYSTDCKEGESFGDQSIRNKFLVIEKEFSV